MPVGPVNPMLPTGIYSGVFGLNGATTTATVMSNGVGFVGAPSNNTASGQPSSSFSAVGAQPPTPYWQPTDTPLLGYLRPAMFTPQQSTFCGNGNNINGSDGGSGGGDFPKLLTNPFADVSVCRISVSLKNLKEIYFFMIQGNRQDHFYIIASWNRSVISLWHTSFHFITKSDSI